MSIKSYQTFKRSQSHQQPGQQQQVVIVYGQPRSDIADDKCKLEVINFDIRRDNKVYPIDIKRCLYNGKPHIVIGSAHVIERRLPNATFKPIYANVNKWRAKTESGLLTHFVPIELLDSRIQLSIKNDHMVGFKITLELGHTTVFKYINELPEYALIDLNELYYRAKEAEELPDDLDELLAREDRQCLEAYDLKLVEIEKKSPKVITPIPRKH